MKKNMILVTGLLRSGTTWTGKTIALARGVKYLNEPFNPDRQRKNSPLTTYYQYLDAGCPAAEQEAIRQYLDHLCRNPFFYLFDQLRLIKRYKAYKNLRPLLLGKKNMWGRPLMKDPIAILSAEWIYQTFRADVVIVLRHPAAFIGSLKTAGWSIPFNGLLAQEERLKPHLDQFSQIIRQYAETPPDVIDQGILIWNIIYSRILRYREKYGSKWYFVKHEALSKNPLEEYSKLFRFLGLAFTPKVREKIIRSSDGSAIGRLSRNSVQNLDTWKTRLTPEEIRRIRQGTAPLYTHFYEEEEWNDGQSEAVSSEMKENRAPGEHKYLFILSPPYCGSTLLHEILSSSRAVSPNNTQGTREGQGLPGVKEIMFDHDRRWDETLEFDWDFIKKQWMKYWDLNKPVLLEKSPPNLIRTEAISKCFQPSFFILLHRDPYAHVESLMRREKWPADKAAAFAIKCMKHQRDNMEKLGNTMALSYEELTDETAGTLDRLRAFMPELSDIRIEKEYDVHNFRNQKLRITNLNSEKRTLLSHETLMAINQVFKKDEEVLTAFGYRIME